MAEYKLLTILWKQNSPYSGLFTNFVQNDVVDVYWSDVSSGFKVYKNGTPITGGNNIPTFFVYNNKDQYYYKSESIDQLVICVGQNRLKYARQAAFPYLASSYLYNHPSCDIPVVCDLQFTSLPVITNASSATATNGQIVVSASSSNGAVQYALNADFAYGAGQTSGTFTGLKAGTYLVYARDAVNCRAVISTKVDITTSYGVKWRLQYLDRLNNTHKTEIKEKGYSGSVTNVEGGVPATTYRLRGEGEREKFLPVLAGEIETQFIATTEGAFSSIYTNDPDKYRLVHTIDGNEVWTGKVLTNQYEENYVNPPYPISIIATDALPELNDILFLDDTGNRLYGEFKQITIIAYILRKLKLGLSIRSACNIYATTMNKAASDDPLDQAYIDVSRYYLIKENPTCGEVLKWILEPYNAQIIQWNNVWNIIRVEERYQAFDYRQFDSNGAYVSNSSYNEIKSLKNSSQTTRMTWANQNQQLRIMPGYGSIRLLYDLGNRKNIIKNGDFRLKSKYAFDLPIDDNDVQLVPDLSGFEVITNNTAIYVGYEDLKDGNIAVVFTSNNTNGDDHLLSETINLKVGSVDKIKFTLRFKVFRSKFDSPSQLFSFRYIKVKAQIRYGSYYLNSAGNWSNFITNITYYIDKDKQNEFVDYEILASNPVDPVTLLPANYSAGENIYIKLFFPNANDAEYKLPTTADCITALKGKLTVSLPVGTRTEIYDIDNTYRPNGLVGKYILFYELEEDKNTQSLADIVRPNDYNDTTNPVQWILKGIQQYDESINTSIAVDKIGIEILNEGVLLPDSETFEQSMENDNPTPVQKQIYHGSLTNNGKTFFSFINTGFGIDIFGQGPSVVQTSGNIWDNQVTFSANSADVSYNGYLRNASGIGYELWERSYFGEAKTLQQIYMDNYSMQYNAPWRMLSGDMYSDDLYFSPISTLKETIDNDRLYIPISMEIDFYQNLYSCEFLELLDINNNAAVGFTNGFSTGFNA